MTGSQQGNAAGGGGEILVRSVKDIHILDIRGELDFQLSQSMKVKLDSLLRLGNHKIVVNLKRVSFIDSSGIGSLIYGLKNVDPIRGDLKIVGLNSLNANIFITMELDRVFSIFESEDQAVQSFFDDDATIH